MIDITLPHKEEYAKKGIILTVVPKTPKSYCVVKLRNVRVWLQRWNGNSKYISYWQYVDMPDSVDEFTYYIKGDYRVDSDAVLKQWAERYRITYRSGAVSEYSLVNYAWSNNQFQGCKKAITWFVGRDGKVYRHVDGEVSEI